MGGEWDSTTVADADVAVFTPIDIDHADRLGNTVTEIARTKAGIIKPGSIVVTAAQSPEAMAEIVSAAGKFGSEVLAEGEAFELLSATAAVGGQVIRVRGRVTTYEDVPLTLHGEHQAHNAALAIAAVESLLGDGSRALTTEVLSEGLGTATSPGRLQYLAAQPPVIVDAAHNPHGAASLARAISETLPFERVWCVLGVLADKDALGIITALDPVVEGFIVTRSASERALAVAELAELVSTVAGAERVRIEPNLSDAVRAARSTWQIGDAVVITGSITLVGEAITLAQEEGWT
jgi:dihydrofolate synthase/folylpolyglutamate synthase